MLAGFPSVLFVSALTAECVALVVGHVACKQAAEFPEGCRQLRVTPSQVMFARGRSGRGWHRAQPHR